MNRVSKRKVSDLNNKKWKRKFRTFVSEMVTDRYLDDKVNPIHADEFLKSFVEAHTGTNEGADMLSGFLRNDLNAAMKQGIKTALKDGVPGILVTQAYFDDMEDNPDKLAEVEKPAHASQYVAGAGRGNEAVGVLYVYRDEGTNPFWLCVHNLRRKQLNGMLDRNTAEIEAAVTQKLPGFSPHSNTVKEIRGMNPLQLLN